MRFIYALSALIAVLPLSSRAVRIYHDAAQHSFVLENQLIRRTIYLGPDSSALTTSSFVYLPSGYDFSREGSIEFSFCVNGQTFSGGKSLSGVMFRAWRIVQPDPSTARLELDFVSLAAPYFSATLCYEMYEGHAACRKWLTIRSETGEPLRLTEVYCEHANLDPWGIVNLQIFADFGRNLRQPPYIGDKNDAAILVVGDKGSLVVGNEAPGFLKETRVYFPNVPNIAAGYTSQHSLYPFARTLGPGEQFTADPAFILLSVSREPEHIFQSELRSFVNNMLSFSILNTEISPSFVYNTWTPFGTEINAKLVTELADALENTGTEYFVIDDGWQDNYGDWNPNPEKFPDGLKPVTEHIKELGMKPGLWISLATIEKQSQAFDQYKSYVVRDEHGNPSNLHGWVNNLDVFTINMHSPWSSYMLDKINTLVETYDLKYLKIDLSAVKSAYVTNPAITGDFGADGTMQQDSYLLIYRSVMQLFDSLRIAHPDVLIDCTYELWGDYHAIDYALLKHAHVDWISNFGSTQPEGALRLRRLAWQRANLTPASSLMIGNQEMDCQNHRLAFVSGFSSTPLMLGDPRKLTADDKQWYALMSGWFAEQLKKYRLAGCYQSLGSSLPSAFDWDAFARFNPHYQGGICCVFRNSSPDAIRYIRLPFVEAAKSYRLSIPGQKGGKVLSGSELQEKGLRVSIPAQDGWFAAAIQEVK